MGPTTTRALLATAGRLVRLDRDDCGNPPIAQVSAVGLRTVGLVGPHRAGSGAWAPRPASGDADGARQRNEPGAVAVLAGAGQARDRAAAPVGDEVDLRREPAARATRRFRIRTVIYLVPRYASLRPTECALGLLTGLLGARGGGPAHEGNRMPVARRGATGIRALTRQQGALLSETWTLPG